MAAIIGGSAKGKTIKCKCKFCDNKFEIVGENCLHHDMLYKEFKTKGIAKDTCKTCTELLEDSDVLHYDEF